MNDTHSFNTALAAEIGIVPAIVFHYMRYWVYLNMINGKNFVEGRHWTYHSMSAIQKHFGYMSVNTISRAVSKLIEKGFLLDGCYNKDPYDKTKWYTLSDMALSRYPFTDFAKTQIAIDQNESFDSPNLGEPIPIIKSNYKKETISNNINIIPNIKESAENHQIQTAPKENENDFDTVFSDTALKLKKDSEVAYNIKSYKVKNLDALLTAFKKHIVRNFKTGEFLSQNYMQNRKWLFKAVAKGVLDLSEATGVRLGVGEYINENGERYYVNPWKQKAIIVPNDAPPRPSDKHIWNKSGGNWIT